MATDAQIAANRRNALNSTGPKTPEGKAATGQNALRHGLRSERAVIFDERAEELADFAAGIRAALAPADGYEASLVERIVHIEWRLRRVWRLEAAALDQEATAGADERLRQAASAALLADWRRRHPGEPTDTAQGVMLKIATGWSEEERREYCGAAGVDVPPQAAPQWPQQLGAIARYEAALERQLHRATLALERRQALRRDGELDADLDAEPAILAAPPAKLRFAEQSQFQKPLPLTHDAPPPIHALLNPLPAGERAGRGGSEAPPPML